MAEQTHKPASVWRLSIRELLAIVAFIALAFAALLNANSVWVTVLVSLSMLVGAGMLVIACVERGVRQAFALGFVALMSVYLLGVLYTASPRNANQLMPGPVIGKFTYDNTLPTTYVLAELWLRVQAPYYATVESSGVGVPFERYDGPIADVGSQGFAGFANIKPPKRTPPGGAGYALGIYPLLSTFLTTGHFLFAFFFAYLGGKFAVRVYHRRVARDGAASDSGTA